MKQVNEMTMAEIEAREFEFKFYNGLLHLYNMEQSQYVQGDIMNYVSPRYDKGYDARISAILFHALEMKGMSQNELERRAFSAYQRHSKYFVDVEAMDMFLCIQLDVTHRETIASAKELINMALDTKDESWFRKLTKVINTHLPSVDLMAKDIHDHLDGYGLEADPNVLHWLAGFVKPAYKFSMEKGLYIDEYEFNRRIFGNPYGPEADKLPWEQPEK